MKNKIKSILQQLDNQSKTVDECLNMVMDEIKAFELIKEKTFGKTMQTVFDIIKKAQDDA